MSDLLSLPDIKTIEPPQENETDMMFKVEAVGPPERCPECGFDKLYKYSSRNQLIMDLPIRLKRVGLQLNRRRYKCRECGSTFWERLISVDEKRSMTKRLLKSIQEQSMSKTFVEVAESVGVDEKTIRNVFKDYVALKEREYQFETPKWLGIDEIHIIRRPRLVLTNIECRTIYDIKPNRNKETVIQRLSEISDRTYIEYVTMDMWKPYKDAVNTILPHAKVVVDKFHVVRMANQALDNVRKSLKAHMSQKERRTLMRERFILLKRKPRFNSSAFNKAMLYDTFNWYEVNDHDITDNLGVDFSTLIKNLEKGDL